MSDPQDTTQDTAPAASELVAAPRLRTLANGAVYDLDKGRIVATPGGGSKAITKETSQQYHELKRAQAQTAILHGIVDGTGAATWRGGVRNMAAAVATIASDPSRGRAAVVAFETLLKMGDLAPKQEREAGSGNSITLQMTDEVASRVVSMLSSRLND